MRRLAVGSGIALVLAAVLIVKLTASGCFPLCVLYTPDNPEYFLFLCYLCG